jgi:hypothetical protein
MAVVRDPSVPSPTVRDDERANRAGRLRLCAQAGTRRADGAALSQATGAERQPARKRPQRVDMSRACEIGHPGQRTPRAARGSRGGRPGSLVLLMRQLSVFAGRYPGAVGPEGGHLGVVEVDGPDPVDYSLRGKTSYPQGPVVEFAVVGCRAGFMHQSDGPVVVGVDAAALLVERSARTSAKKSDISIRRSTPSPGPAYGPAPGPWTMATSGATIVPIGLRSPWSMASHAAWTRMGLGCVVM